MKPLFPHDPRNDPFDDLIAAALHGELTPEERTQFDARLQTDPAAQAAYQEAQAMHDLLEKTHKNAQPDPAFEQRMVSGVRRKIQHEDNRESGLESLLILWAWLKKFPRRFRLVEVAVVLGIIAILAGVALGPITSGIKQSKQSEEMQARRQAQLEKDSRFADTDRSSTTTDLDQLEAAEKPVSSPPVFKRRNVGVHRPEGTMMAGDEAAAKIPPSDAPVELERLTKNESGTTAFRHGTIYSGGTTASAGTLTVNGMATTTPQGGTIRGSGFVAPIDDEQTIAATSATSAPAVPAGESMDKTLNFNVQAKKQSLASKLTDLSGAQARSADGAKAVPSVTMAAPAPVIDTRKLIRNAQLDLEVKSFQAAVDQITTLTKAAGGYVDTSSSQKGGNGKLQGAVVVKVLPQNLDNFLLKLRDLGQVKNQSVSTDDVTKDYFDTQARLDNSRRMETQLQDLLKHANSKVSDLLQVERELGRVRGDIEKMQGQLKLYDFQVQYATVTIRMREKDLNQAAAYLLKEQDRFSLFATDVEGTFQKARQTADDFKAQVLAADLNHNSGSDVSAELVVMVAPDQIEPFLMQVRSLGRVANFTRQTQRVARDGGNSDQPADQALTEKDRVQVRLAIRSDDETRKRVALTVVAKAVDDALDQAKAAALANVGVEVLGSSLNKTPQGQSTAQLTVRVPGKDYSAVIDSFRTLGRTASLSIQRNDNSGPGTNGDDAPVIVTLALTDDDTPLQETAMSVLAADVDGQAQQIKKDAASAGVEVKASSFERQPDGTELAEMTFRLPMSKYPAFVESVKKLGKVESLTVRREDRPDQTRTDETAPAEISLQLHNQRDIVADNSGLWATLRQTFGEGGAALFGSVRVIGVMVAFLVPWVFTLGLLAWVGRRIYIWRKK